MLSFKQFLLENEHLDKQLIDAIDRHGSLWNKDKKQIIFNLINQGADINVNNGYPLRWAVNRHDLEMIKFLIEKGADIHRGDDVALRIAINRSSRTTQNEDNLEVIKYLISKMDPTHVIKKYPKYAEYIVDPKFSNAKFAGKYGMLGND